jgi:hypothetical protein
MTATSRTARESAGAPVVCRGSPANPQRMCGSVVLLQQFSSISLLLHQVTILARAVRRGPPRSSQARGVSCGGGSRSVGVGVCDRRSRRVSLILLFLQSWASFNFTTTHHMNRPTLLDAPSRQPLRGPAASNWHAPCGDLEGHLDTSSDGFNSTPRLVRLCRYRFVVVL